MSSNGMSLGVDYDFGLYDGTTGTLVELGDIQSISMTMMKHDLKSSPYNDMPTYAHVTDGYSGTFEIVRTSSALEDLQIELNRRFNAGFVMKPGFINKTVSNPDGTVKKYQYIKVDFAITSEGTVTRDNNVRQTVEWKASNEVPVL